MSYSNDALVAWVEVTLSPSRYAHTMRVVEQASRLAAIYGADVQQVQVASVLHDCARELSVEDQLELAAVCGVDVTDVERHSGALLHAKVGAEMARRECGVEDEEVLAAIRCHTTGRAGMSLLDKVLFVADYIEPCRSFPGVELVREAAAYDLDRATLTALDQTIAYVLQRHALLHPATIEARNDLLLQEAGPSLIGRAGE